MEELAAVTPLNNPILTSGADTESLTDLSGEAPVPVNFSNDTLTGGTSTADIDTRRILEVTGTGEVSVPTSLTQVELGIQVQAQTATEVTEELAQSSTAVVDVLQDLGAQELQTTSIQLNPVYSFEDDVQTLTGFEGRNILEFQLPTDQAGAAIDAAITAGANLVQGISFIASENALQQARKEALTEAVQDAQAQGEVVLSSLQLAPGDIINIEIGAADISTPSPLLFDAASPSAFAASTPILGGPQTVDATVSLDTLYFPDPADTLALAADTDTRRILEVTGTGEVSVPTSLTQVELGIQVQAQTATEVTEELAQSSTAVVDVLQDLGAQELQTTSIQLNPVYSFEDDVQTLTGFEGRNILEFQLPTDQAGAAIDAAITAGANLVQDISFVASENALQQARKEALTEAVQDAQAQAEVVLSSLQLAPGDIIKIEIGAADISTPSPLLFDRTSAEGLAASTPILGGPQTVDATVSLDILYFRDTADTLAPATGDTLADLSIQYGSSLSPTSLTPGSDISNVSFDPLSSGANILATGFLSGSTS